MNRLVMAVTYYYERNGRSIQEIVNLVSLLLNIEVFQANNWTTDKTLSLLINKAIKEN